MCHTNVFGFPCKIKHDFRVKVDTITDSGKVVDHLEYPQLNTLLHMGQRFLLAGLTIGKGLLLAISS